jgi:hypothetical protein
VNPLTRRRGAAKRPQIALMILAGLAFVLMQVTPAEAGRRGRRSKKSRSQSHAHKQPREQQAPAPTVTNDDKPREGTRLAKEDDAPARPGSSKAKEKVFDFTGLELAGSVRMPQLLYFLDRAEEELERASLERRSFVPAMMRSLDEENL